MPNPSTLREDTDYHGNEDCHDSFDFDSLDSLEDRIKEAIAKGEPVAALVAQLVDMECSERVNEAIAGVLCHIADSRKPKLAVDYLAYACGLRMTQGVSGEALARKHKIRKQAFSQAALRLIKKLGIPPSRSMRSAKGRESMAKAYRERMNTKRK
jgi:hypothetical protein